MTRYMEIQPLAIVPEVRRNALGDYSGLLRSFAVGAAEHRWDKGCHDCGYDYIDLNNVRDFSTVKHLAAALLPPHCNMDEGPLWTFRVLRMREGNVVPEHLDEREGGYEVFSLNVLLQPPEFGGALKINSLHAHLGVGDGARYCATRMPHEITEVKKGNLYLFSAQTIQNA